MHMVLEIFRHALILHLERHLFHPLSPKLSDRLSEHCSHSSVSDVSHQLEVKIPFYYKQMCHKCKLKPLKTCINQIQ